jgi:hypothetical protein
MVKDIYGGNHSFLVLHDLAGSELLDPQYDEYPADISKGDFRHYFEPIALTDATGGPMPIGSSLTYRNHASNCGPFSATRARRYPRTFWPEQKVRSQPDTSCIKKSWNRRCQPIPP